MKTDYSIIAKTYDLASFRSVEIVDDTLLELANKSNHITVLDLACGTGTYMKAQKAYINNATFIGVDNSNDMLAQAKKKGINSLILADADNGLPFDDNSLDYIVCRYGFHHFKNKSFVLSEVKRCLRSKGVFSMLNVDPHSNKTWWVYKLFPEIADTDRQRFWKAEDLVLHLKNLDFEVVHFLDIGPEIMYRDMLLERLQIRDTSQLHMIDQKIYENKIREVENWPNDKFIEGDYAFLSVKGRKL